MDTLIVGSGDLSRRVATRLDADGRTCLVVDDDRVRVDRARAAGLRAKRVDLRDAYALRTVVPGRVATAVVTTDTDSRNLLAAQSLASADGVERVVVLLNHPANGVVFDDLAVETVCSTNVLADALATTADRPLLP
ncbi:NAD-binding protein [Halomarina ordinaria]|uniref:NAD-binding protein n=1 Tax=Halomarina ordinaria TaxID=3033939 RepID=A0ABD5U736_9EURY|nr:NAD-binding protein [Halomarina sp. PSRA2]